MGSAALDSSDERVCARAAPVPPTCLFGTPLILEDLLLDPAKDSSTKHRPSRAHKRMVLAGLSLSVAMAATAASAQETAGDPAAGERVYRQCAACHSIEPGQNRAGPHLFGIVGQNAGSVEGFRYSQAMRDADIVWNEENLTAYVTDPRGFLPGTTMRVALRDPDDAADLVAYLRTLSSE